MDDSTKRSNPSNIEYPLQFRYDSARSDVNPRMKTNFATVPRELRQHGTQNYSELWVRCGIRSVQK